MSDDDEEGPVSRHRLRWTALEWTDREGGDRGPRRSVHRRPERAGGRARRRLFTATAAVVLERRVMIVFHASVARSPEEVRARLCRRLGQLGAAMARISEGYDDMSFIARTIVTPALRELIREVEAHPYGFAARGFDVHHTQLVGVDLFS